MTISTPDPNAPDRPAGSAPARAFVSGASRAVVTRASRAVVTSRFVTFLGMAVASFAFLAVGACSESDPFGLNDWTLNPDTATIYSLSLDDLNIAAAFDFTERATRPVAVRDEFGNFNNWDVALDVEGGELVLLPQSMLGVISEAAVLELPNMNFTSIEEAPADTALYNSTSSTSLRTTSVYIVRTRKVTRQSFFSQTCVYYAKVQPLRVDPIAGVLEFLYDVNSDFSGCNNRALIPPEN